MMVVIMRIFLAIFVLALASQAAFADVYRWTDANGTTVFSSTPPEEGSGARNVVIVAKERVRVIRGTKETVESYTPSNQQILVSRVESLERQVQAQQYAQAAIPQYQAAYSTGYYSTPAPSYYYTDPYDGYYDGYYGGYYDPYYSPYYGGYYSYPYAFYPSGSVFVRPRAFVGHRTSVRPFVHGSFGHGSFGHGGSHGVARGGGAVRGGGVAMRGGGGHR
jgi:hypothetical protein